MKKVLMLIFIGLLFVGCSNNTSNPFDNSESNLNLSDEVTTYTIKGTIIDEDDNVVPEVVIDLYLQENFIASCKTNENGEYFFGNLENGTYTLKIKKTPFVCDEDSPSSEKLIIRDKSVNADPIVLIKDKTIWGPIQ